MRVPLLWVALGAMAGILTVDQSALWLLLPLALSVLLFQRRRPHLVLIAGMLAAFLVFALLHLSVIHSIHRFPLRQALEEPRRPLEISGKGWIASDTNRRTGNSIRVVIQLEALRVRETPIPLVRPHRVLCLIDHPFAANLEYGSEIAFSGNIERIPPATSPGAFDPAAYFYRSARTSSQVAIDSGNRCAPTGIRRGNRLRWWAISSRQWMEKALLHGIRTRDRELAGMIPAMVLGAREESPDDVEDFFRLSGTMHIFAVSGLHVGVVALLFWSLLKWIGLSRRQAALLIIPAVLFYALITGLRPSSFRAAVMLTAVLGGIALKQKSSPVNGLGLAALVLLGVDTQQLFLPGFQLSFCVVLFISLGAGLLTKRFHGPFAIDSFLPRTRVSPWRRGLDEGLRLAAAGVAVSVASWIGSVLLMSSHFGGISPAGLVANVFMVPIAAAIVVIAGISAALFGVRLGFLSALLNHFNLGLASFLAGLAQFFAHLPGSHVHTGLEPAGPGNGRIEFTVMGIRGESAVFVSDGEKRWMLDSGGRNTFRSQALPLLREKGVNRIDGLILSHGDSGHIGAAPYLLQHLTPRLVIESAFPNRARVYPEIADLMTRRKINRLSVEAGDRLRWSDNTTWEILYPGEAEPPTGTADDRCLVLRLRNGSWRFLFTFDAGFLIEKRLIRERWDLRSDVWVRGQHSNTPSGSPEFVDQVDPRVIISSNARFPPHERLDEDWIERIEKEGRRILTLDETGSVRVDVDPRAILVTPFLGDEVIRIER